MNEKKVSFGSPWSTDSKSESERDSAKFKNEIESRFHHLYCTECMNDFADKQFTPEPYQSAEESRRNALAKLRREFNDAIDAYEREGDSLHK